jgi:membrane protein implicated in regulation of membrane protease activity
VDDSAGLSSAAQWRLRHPFVTLVCFALILSSGFSLLILAAGTPLASVGICFALGFSGALIAGVIAIMRMRYQQKRGTKQDRRERERRATW